MKHIFGMSLLGLCVAFTFAIVVVPSTTLAALPNCSTLPVPLMSITIPGYGTFANSAGTPDGVFSITVPSGTALSATYHNAASPGTPYTFIGDSWPGGSDQHAPPPVSSPFDRTHTSGAITSSSQFSLGVDRDCIEDPSPEFSGSVQVNVSVTGPYALTVSKAGTGTGTVTSSPAGISCGVDCSESYASGTSVTLSQSASAGSTFAGWSGACTGTGSCVVSMTSAKSVTATFNTSSTPPSCSANPPTVFTGQNTTVIASGGTGSFTWSVPGGTACGSGTTCVTSYSTTGPKTVTVTSGGQTGTCNVTVSENSNALSCDAVPASVATGQSTTITASGGTGSYAWDTGGGSACSAGTTCTTSYSTGGSKTVTVTSGLDTATCPVVVTSSLACYASASPIQAGGTATFNGTGGSTYSWSAPTGTPTSGTGSTFNTVYTSGDIGSNTVTVTSGGNTAQCSVDVQAGAPALAVSLLVNGRSSDTINYGDAALLTWSASSVATACRGSESPTGDPDWPWPAGVGWLMPTSGSRNVEVGSPIISRVYTIECHDAVPAIVSDTVDVTVRPECLPAGQTVAVNEQATLSARGGTGTYAWTATGGTPASGAGASFAVAFATAGTKTVSLGSGSLSDSCTVTVTDATPTTGTVVVTSNVPTTWTLTRPAAEPISQGTPSSGETYTDQDVGTYTLANVPDIEGYEPPTYTSSQNLSAGGTITFAITYTLIGGGGGASVDLTANGSNNPDPVVRDDTVALAWTGSGLVANSCVASDDWSGEKLAANGTSDVTAAVTSNKPNMVFLITCDAEEGGTVSDTVTVRLTQCGDGIDNDGQNGIDYPADAEGCTALSDDLEASQADQEPPVAITECSDTLDNDGDGFIDFPDDDGCTSLEDNSERFDPDVREI